MEPIANIPDDSPAGVLAFEVALRYFSDADLCQRYGIEQSTLDALKENTQFQQAVLACRRNIDEKGTEFKTRARKLASETIPVLGVIAMDGTADHSDRIAAIKELARYAGYATEQAASGGTAFNVQINLSPPA